MGLRLTWRARQNSVILLIVLLLLAGLPISVFLDVRLLMDSRMERQARDVTSLITSFRNYYARNVVARVLSDHGGTQVLPNYASVPGAIPIPATLSLELGKVLNDQQTNISYRFISDYPFKNRASHTLDDYEIQALSALRADAKRDVTQTTWSWQTLSLRVRLVTPVVMTASCVDCHNTHPDSPKTDWKIGDVRGIQEVTVSQGLAVNILSFKYLLTYLLFAATAGFSFIMLQRRQTAVIRALNREADAQIKSLAFYDPLTGLPNRRLLRERMHQALAAATQTKRDGALILLDLDNFKTVNDTKGHDQGDRLLQDVARRLTSSFREADTVARIGGDEFVVLLSGLSESPTEAATQVETATAKIMWLLGAPHDIADTVFHCPPSIGITLFGEGRDNIDELLMQADIALFQAKAAGRNTVQFFDPELQSALHERADLESELRHAISHGQLALYYQPQMNSDGQLTGAEALVRWLHPTKGVLAPGQFIPLAEDTGLILPLGNWVLESACTQLAAWSQIAETAGLMVAVNVSAHQFKQADFVDQVLSVIDHTGADPHRLKLELTESLLLENIDQVIIKMGALKSKGISFSLDDFGTGYSSLLYLKQLPLDQLKIDRSFVRDILHDSNDAVIARTIVALGQSLGLNVIAEGVETSDQMDFLATSGCFAYQGYFFAKPLPWDKFQDFIRNPLVTAEP